MLTLDKVPELVDQDNDNEQDNIDIELYKFMEDAINEIENADFDVDLIFIPPVNRGDITDEDELDDNDLEASKIKEIPGKLEVQLHRPKRKTALEANNKIQQLSDCSLTKQHDDNFIEPQRKIPKKSSVVVMKYWIYI